MNRFLLFLLLINSYYCCFSKYKLDDKLSFEDFSLILEEKRDKIKCRYFEKNEDFELCKRMLYYEYSMLEYEPSDCELKCIIYE